MPGERCGNLRHLHQGQNSFLHAGTAAGAADDNQRQIVVGCPFHQAGQALADDATHSAHEECRIGDTDRHPAVPNHSGPANRRISNLQLCLFADQFLWVRTLIDEAQWIGGLDLGVPFLERPLVQHLLDASPGRDVPVVAAFRTNTLSSLGFLAEDGVRTARTTLPEPFVDTAFRPFAEGKGVVLGHGN